MKMVLSMATDKYGHIEDYMGSEVIGALMPYDTSIYGSIVYDSEIHSMRIDKCSIIRSKLRNCSIGIAWMGQSNLRNAIEMVGCDIDRIEVDSYERKKTFFIETPYRLVFVMIPS